MISHNAYTSTSSLTAFIRRCICTGFCSPDLADFHDLYISSDKKLFNKILTCPSHILRTLLPPTTSQKYSLENRPHNRQLPDRISRITDCNFYRAMLCICGTSHGPVSVCVCLCLCPSVTSRFLLKRQNVGSHKQHRTIRQGL